MISPDAATDPTSRVADLRSEPPAVRPLVGLLRQLAELVESLTDEEYARGPVGVVSGSVGGHVRHNLDHVASLLRGLRSGRINYDVRDRATSVERDRLAALDEIRRLERELVGFPWADIPWSVELTSLVAPDLPPVTTATSPGRELAFVVSHTIHHNAIIGIMAKLLGAGLPDGFGYAPSTIVHRRGRACVR
jgi:uncharacterized damage-inducible protein DinB